MKKKKEDESRILQIALYLEKGNLSQNKIAGAVHVSKNLVSTVSRVMKENGWNLADAALMSEKQRKELFKRTDLPNPAPKRESVYAEPDYEYYCKELLKPGVTKALLHEGYVAECVRAGTVPLQLTQFKVHLGDRHYSDLQ